MLVVLEVFGVLDLGCGEMKLLSCCVSVLCELDVARELHFFVQNSLRDL